MVSLTGALSRAIRQLFFTPAHMSSTVTMMEPMETMRRSSPQNSMPGQAFFTISLMAAAKKSTEASRDPIVMQMMYGRLSQNFDWSSDCTLVFSDYYTIQFGISGVSLLTFFSLFFTVLLLIDVAFPSVAFLAIVSFNSGSTFFGQPFSAVLAMIQFAMRPSLPFLFFNMLLSFFFLTGQGATPRKSPQQSMRQTLRATPMEKPTMVQQMHLDCEVILATMPMTVSSFLMTLKQQTPKKTLQMSQRTSPATASPREVALKVRARRTKRANSSMMARMEEEQLSMLMFLRCESAVSPLSMQLLHTHTRAISTMEQIVAGKYRVGDVISRHTFLLSATPGYELAGQVSQHSKLYSSFSLMQAVQLAMDPSQDLQGSVQMRKSQAPLPTWVAPSLQKQQYWALMQYLQSISQGSHLAVATFSTLPSPQTLTQTLLQTVSPAWVLVLTCLKAKLLGQEVQSTREDPLQAQQDAWQSLQIDWLEMLQVLQGHTEQHCPLQSRKQAKVEFTQAVQYLLVSQVRQLSRQASLMGQVVEVEVELLLALVTPTVSTTVSWADVLLKQPMLQLVRLRVTEAWKGCQATLTLPLLLVWLHANGRLILAVEAGIDAKYLGFRGLLRVRVRLVDRRMGRAGDSTTVRVLGVQELEAGVVGVEKVRVACSFSDPAAVISVTTSWNPVAPLTMGQMVAGLAMVRYSQLPSPPAPTLILLILQTPMTVLLLMVMEQVVLVALALRVAVRLPARSGVLRNSTLSQYLKCRRRQSLAEQSLNLFRTRRVPVLREYVAVEDSDSDKEDSCEAVGVEQMGIVRLLGDTRRQMDSLELIILLRVMLARELDELVKVGLLQGMGISTCVLFTRSALAKAYLNPVLLLSTLVQVPASTPMGRLSLAQSPAAPPSTFTSRLVLALSSPVVPAPHLLRLNRALAAGRSWGSSCKLQTCEHRGQQAARGAKQVKVVMVRGVTGLADTAWVTGVMVLGLLVVLYLQVLVLVPVQAAAEVMMLLLLNTRSVYDVLLTDRLTGVYGQARLLTETVCPLSPICSEVVAPMLEQAAGTIVKVAVYDWMLQVVPVSVNSRVQVAVVVIDAWGLLTDMLPTRCSPLPVSDQLLTLAVMMLLLLLTLATAPLSPPKPMLISLASQTILSTVPQSKQQSKVRAQLVAVLVTPTVLLQPLRETASFLMAVTEREVVTDSLLPSAQMKMMVMGQGFVDEGFLMFVMRSSMVAPRALVGVGAVHSITVLLNLVRHDSRLFDTDPLVRKYWKFDPQGWACQGVHCPNCVRMVTGLLWLVRVSVQSVSAPTMFEEEVTVMARHID